MCTPVPRPRWMGNGDAVYERTTDRIVDSAKRLAWVETSVHFPMALPPSAEAGAWLANAWLVSWWAWRCVDASWGILGAKPGSSWPGIARAAEGAYL